jgi:hypothetical protein
VKFRKQIENVIKAEQIKGLRTNMNKVVKFSGSILIDESFVKKKAEDGGKMAKIKEAKDLIVLWMGLIRC